MLNLETAHTLLSGRNISATTALLNSVIDLAWIVESRLSDDNHGLTVRVK